MSKEKRTARFHAIQEIGRGCFIITFLVEDDSVLDYEPGHVFTLEYIDESENNHKHPYTIIACVPEKHLISFAFRHIPEGALTPHFLNMDSDSRILFHGKGHNAIRDDINQAATQVIGVATGSGVGPLYGYVKKHIHDLSVPHTFFLGYRQQADICLQDELDELCRQQPLFTWHPCLSQAPDGWNGLIGHAHLAATQAVTFNKTTHVHMVGNGHMISELRTALIRVNLPTEFISKESFFKHGEVVREDIVNELKLRITTK